MGKSGSALPMIPGKRFPVFVITVPICVFAEIPVQMALPPRICYLSEDSLLTGRFIAYGTGFLSCS